MPGDGARIGDIHVDVSPDAADFWTKFVAQARGGAGRAGDQIGAAAGQKIADRISDGVAKGLDQAARAVVAKGAKAGAEYGTAFGKEAKNRAEAALRDVKVNVKVDTAGVSRTLSSIDKLLERIDGRTVTVTVEADITRGLVALQAVAEAIRFLDKQRATVEVRADTGSSKAELAALKLQLAGLSGKTVNVNVDTGSSSSRLGSLASGASSSGGHLSAMIGVGALIAPVIVPAAAAAAAGIAAVGTAALAGAAGLGVGIAAFSGVIGAVKNMSAAQEQASRAGATMANRNTQVAGALDQVRSAEASLANTRASAAEAQRRAVRQVADAERDVARAQDDARRAQLALNEAIAREKEDRQDLEQALKGNAIAQRRASAEVTAARVRLAETGSAVDQLAYDEAVLQQEDLLIRGQRLTQERQANQRVSVEGSKQVVAAQQGVVSAQDKIADAERQVSEAREQAAVAARQSAFQIAQAQQGVINAQRSLQTASVSAGVAGSAAMDKLQQSMADLSPEGRRFATFLYGLKTPLLELRRAAEAGVLPGVEAAMRGFLPFLPQFKAFVGEIAAALGGLAQSAGKALVSPEARKFFAFVAETAVPNLKLMAETAGQVIRGFAGLLIGFGPLSKDIGAGILDLATKFGNFGATSSTNPGFQRFLDYIRENGPKIMALLGDLGTVFGKLMIALAPLGSLVLDGLVGLFDFLSKLSPGQLIAVATGVTAIGVALAIAFNTNPIGLIITAIVAFVGLLVYAYKNSETFRDVVNAVAGAIGERWASTWNNILRPTFTALVDLWTNVIAPAAMWLWHNVLEPAFAGIAAAASFIWENILKPVFTAIAWYMTNVLAPVAMWLWHNVIEPVWAGIQFAITVAWTAIQIIFGLIQIYIKAVLAPVFTWLWHNIIEPVWNGISAVVGFVWNNGIKPVLSALGGFIREHVAPAFKTGVEAIGRAWEGLREVARVPIAFVVNQVINPLIRGYNDLAGVFNVGKVKEIGGFATGGYIVGPGGPTDDAILARLSAGEYVIPARIVSALGVDFFDQIIGKGGVGGKRPGDGSEGIALPAFADGGIVGAFKNIWNTVTDPGSALKAAANAALRNMPGGGLLRSIVANMGSKLIDGLASWIGGGAGKGDIGKTQAFLRAQDGKPYIWAAAGPAGYDCCIIAGVRIYGPEGAKPIEDVRAGDRVYSYVDGKLEPYTVTAAWQSKRQPVFAVRTRNRTVTASANHPFLRVIRSGTELVEHWEDAEWPGAPERYRSDPRRGSTCSVSPHPTEPFSNGMCRKHRARWSNNGDPRITLSRRAKFDVEWARLDELKRGDLLVQPRRMPTEATLDPRLEDGTPIDVDVAWLIGAAVGDGTVTDKALRLCLYGADRDRAERIAVTRWGGKPTRGASYGLIISKASLAKSLTALGMRVLGPSKRVPEVVWTWPADLQRAFLDGYCDADGHRPTDKKRHGERTYHSASRELIEDVRALHIALGDPISNVTETKRTKPIIIKGKLVKNARTQHAVTVWPDNGHGEARLRNHPGLADWLDAGDFTLGTILAVDPKGEADTWDLNVEDAHNFVADGVVVHNSGIVSAAWNIMHGKNPYQHTFSTHNEAAYFPKPGHGPFTAGWSHAGQRGGGSVGHTAGNLAGLAFESAGSTGVRLGSKASPVDSFANVGTYDSGGVLPPGLTLAYNGTGQNEYVLKDAGTAPTGNRPADTTRGLVHIENMYSNGGDIDAVARELDWVMRSRG